MTETVANPSAGWRMKVAAFALAVSIFTALWFVVAALGTKFGLWPWQVGLGQMTGKIGAPLAFLALGLGLIAQIIALIKFPRKQAFMVALAATLIAAYSAGRLIAMKIQAESVPPIHDIQTDWSDPIRFSEAILAARQSDGDTNPVLDAPRIDDERVPPSLLGRLVSEVQEEAENKEANKGTVYPKLEPLYFANSPTEIATLAETLIAKKGWKLVSPAPSGGDTGMEILIEATAISGWFGFKDDVAVRIRPVEGATRVDMRSISRVGLSDLGLNSRRVSGFMYELGDKGNGRAAP
ncbi:MAG: DUF1499 domain-containing protein [Henriciella sp.]|nr:DUF1499 domain-containing protein [Henriciella sp.]